jgi:hypothetical protein
LQTITIPKSIELSALNLDKILSQIDSLDNDDKEVLFDFSGTTWIPAELTVFLGSLIVSLQGKAYTVYFSTLDLGIKQILSKNGFLKTHSLSEEKLIDNFRTTISYEIFQSREYEKINEYLTDEVFDKVKEHVNSESIEMISANVYEIVQNIEEHSGSKQVFICGQYYPKKGELSLAISDVGISIPKKIRTACNFENLTDSKLISWATEKGNSTKTSKASGLGLYELKESFSDVGEMLILSQKGLLVYNGVADVSQIDLNAIFPGTLLHLKFLIDKEQIK